MRFEHLVQINDPLLPLLDELSREQLWRGLVLRAEQPLQFMLGLEGFAVRAREEEGSRVTLARTLDFGSFCVRDRVHLTPMQETRIQTEAGATWPASRLTIRIEEPEPDELHLRFIYEFDDEAGAAAGAEARDELSFQTLELRRQAYRASDLDTVKRIRDLAQQGRLG